MALPSIDAARLKAHVVHLSCHLVPRDHSHPENLDRVAAYIQQEFEQSQAIVTEQTFKANDITYRNVLAQFGPDTPERIIIGAHYDAAGEHPAADDNASGIAGLIELGHLLSTVSLKMRVELVAYTLEEPPYFRTPAMGSAVHAKSLKEAGVAVRFMLALEMIGCFRDEPDSQSFPLSILKLFYPAHGNFIALVGKLDQTGLVHRIKKIMRRATPLPVHSINAPAVIPGIDFSDHMNYWNEGYAAVMITDTSFYRNPRYHTSRDTYDTLDYKRMAMVVQGVYAVVLEEAG